MRDFDIEILEQMAARFNPFPTNDDFLDSRYQWQMTSNGVEWPYYRFFYHLSKWLQPGLVVELGGWQGTAAAHFAAGYEQAKIITIDHHTDPGDEENKAKMLQACKTYSNIMYIQGWSNSEAAAREYGKHKLGTVGSVYQDMIEQTLYYGRKIDILFIDSWHNYENAMLDWETYKPLLNSPSLVICDDIQEGGGPESPISGMLKFWDELPEPKFLNANLHPGTNMGFLKYAQD
jgi:predicted O-methyltransferase YrrM